MPKTAGLSFRASLEEYFGDRFRHDYQDYPLASSPEDRREQASLWGQGVQAEEFNGVDCVHGHFLPLKYLRLADSLPCCFVTWLREPVARLVSHYHYWRQAYDPASGSTSALHRRVIEERWTLEQFCLAPELRNVYSEFLWGMPFERLNFIGITEFYAEDLRYFSQEILGNKLQPHTLNQRREAQAGGIDRALSDTARARIEHYHRADLALYRRALALREQRVSGGQAPPSQCL